MIDGHAVDDRTPAGDHDAGGTGEDAAAAHREGHVRGAAEDVQTRCTPVSDEAVLHQAVRAIPAHCVVPGRAARGAVEPDTASEHHVAVVLADIGGVAGVTAHVHDVAALDEPEAGDRVASIGQVDGGLGKAVAVERQVEDAHVGRQDGAVVGWTDQWSGAARLQLQP